jgi:hypothetical protein
MRQMRQEIPPYLLRAGHHVRSLIQYVHGILIASSISILVRVRYNSNGSNTLSGITAHQFLSCETWGVS